MTTTTPTPPADTGRSDPPDTRPLRDVFGTIAAEYEDEARAAMDRTHRVRCASAAEAYRHAAAIAELRAESDAVFAALAELDRVNP